MPKNHFSVARQVAATVEYCCQTTRSHCRSCHCHYDLMQARRRRYLLLSRQPDVQTVTLEIEVNAVRRIGKLKAVACHIHNNWCVSTYSVKAHLFRCTSWVTFITVHALSIATNHLIAATLVFGARLIMRCAVVAFIRQGTSCIGAAFNFVAVIVGIWVATIFVCTWIDRGSLSLQSTLLAYPSWSSSVVPFGSMQNSPWQLPPT